MMSSKSYRTSGIALLGALGVTLFLVNRHEAAILPTSYHSLISILLVGGGLCLLLAAFTGWGALARKAFGLTRAADLMETGALGALVTGTALGACSWFWIPSTTAMLAWLGVGLGVGLAIARSAQRPTPPDGAMAAPSRERSIAGVVLGLFALPPLLLAICPPISLDSLVYHLGVPQQYLIAGRAFEMPWNLHAYFPFHGEMLFTLALRLGSLIGPLTGAVVAQLLHLTAAVATIVVADRLADRLFGRYAGITAAILLVSIPAINVISGWASVDWFVLLYLALAIETYLRFAEHRETKELTAMALFIGGAIAVKYSALPILALFALAIPAVGIAPVAARAAIAIVVALPWYGHNLLVTGNPFYPLFDGRDATKLLTSYRAGGDDGLLGALLAYRNRPELLDESVGVLFFCALPFALIALLRRARRPPAPLFILAAVYLAAAIIYQPTIRALAPLLFVTALLIAGGVASVMTDRRWRIGITAVALPLLFINLGTVLRIVKSYEPVDYLIGSISAERYLAEGQSYYEAFRWLNAVPGDGGVLLVGESRSFYMNRRAIAGAYLYGLPLRVYVSGADDADEVADALARDRIAYVYFDQADYRVGERPAGDLEAIYYASEHDDRLLRALLATHARVIYNQGSISIHALTPPGAAGSQ